jgi:hypothetical protein
VVGNGVVRKLMLPDLAGLARLAMEQIAGVLFSFRRMVAIPRGFGGTNPSFASRILSDRRSLRPKAFSDSGAEESRTPDLFVAKQS